MVGSVTSDKSDIDCLYVVGGERVGGGERDSGGEGDVGGGERERLLHDLYLMWLLTYVETEPQALSSLQDCRQSVINMVTSVKNTFSLGCFVKGSVQRAPGAHPVHLPPSQVRGALERTLSGSWYVFEDWLVDKGRHVAAFVLGSPIELCYSGEGELTYVKGIRVST
jgi:hypothetical protein